MLQKYEGKKVEKVRSQDRPRLCIDIHMFLKYNCAWTVKSVIKGI